MKTYVLKLNNGTVPGIKKRKKSTWKASFGNSLVIQWFGLCSSLQDVGVGVGMDSIPDQETKILQAMWHTPRKEKEKKKED